MSESGSSHGPIKRKPVKFNQLGKAVGTGSTHFMNRLANIVKSHVSVKYTSWKVVKKVAPHTINDMWNAVQMEFIVPDQWKEFVVKEMPKTYRRYKHKLRTEYLDDPRFITLEDQIANPPPGVKPEDWEVFCKYEDDPLIKARRKKNQSNRNMLKYSHSGGRYSSAMIEDQLIEENPDDEIDRTKVWIKSHTKKDGSIIKGAESDMAKVKAVVVEQASTQSKSGTQLFPLSLDADPLASVFGKDSNGRVRAVGSTISKRQCAFAAPAISILREQGKEKNDLKMEVKTIGNKLDSVLEYLHMASKQGDNVQHPPSFPSVNGPQNNVPPVESTHVPQTSSGSRLRNCELRDLDDEIVALATIVTDKTKDVCHGYKLNPERDVKVVLVSIEKPDTKIFYKAKYLDGAETLEDILPGGYLIWPKSFVTYA